MAGAVVVGQLWECESTIHTPKPNGDIQRLDAVGLKLLNDLHKTVRIRHCCSLSQLAYRMPTRCTEVDVLSIA